MSWRAQQTRTTYILKQTLLIVTQRVLPWEKLAVRAGGIITGDCRTLTTEDSPYPHQMQVDP